MSSLSIALYFPFSRVKVCRQSVSIQDGAAFIDIEPDRRFAPICHECGARAGPVHSHEVRVVRDLDFPSVHVWLRLSYRKVLCPRCRRIVVEEQELVEPFQRVTTRLARLIHELCKVMTVSDVARHLALDWKTVKNIDKQFLEQKYGQTDYGGLRVLAVDEIAVRKGHSYMTVVIDYETGRVVWMGKDRTRECLAAFFAGMTQQHKARIEAVAMDMWEPYMQAVREAVPNAEIVFDLYHVVAAYNKVIDRVRMAEYRKASIKDRAVFKGARYLLLRRRLERAEQREHLRELLDLNETLFFAHLLRDKLALIWRYRYRAWAARALDEWCALALAVGHPELESFARKLQRHREGILSHCLYPIHTGRLEGINNTIKVIKRQAYGFHDGRYFTLKVIQAFAPNVTN